MTVYCVVCGRDKDSDYAIYKDNNYYCCTDCAAAGYTVRQLNLVSSGGGILSTPPTGSFKVVNIYVNPETGKLTIEYDNTPT
jgi:hypothetical protein